MKTRIALILIAVVVLAAIAGDFATSRVRAGPDIINLRSQLLFSNGCCPWGLAFGAVGIASGQTARVNVTSLSPAAPSDPTAVEIRFLDSNGAVVKQTTVTLAPGQSAAFDFSLADVTPGAASSRMQIRAEVQVTVAPGPGETPPSALVSTLEVFDNATGKTSFLYAPGPAFEAQLFPLQ